MKTTYTITKSEIKKLVKTRQAQCANFSSEYYKEHGELPSGLPANNSNFAHVQFVNGKTDDFAFSTGKLAKWIEFFPNMDCEQVFDVAIQDEKISVRSGGSEIVFSKWNESIPFGLVNSRFTVPKDMLGEPLRLVAPANGGEFKLETVANVPSDFNALKKQVAAQRKTVKQNQSFQKEFRSACLAVNEAKAQFRKAVGAFLTAKGVLSAQTYQDALKQQRLALSARRMFRKSFANLDVPAWFLKTYSVERLETVYPLDESGKPVVRDAWRKDWELEMATAEYVNSKPRFAEFSYFFETMDVRSMVQVDTVEAFGELLAKLSAAHGELENYKPRKLVAVARYVSHRRGWRKPLLKQDVLAQNIKAAELELREFIMARFQDYCDANGISHNIVGMILRGDGNKLSSLKAWSHYWNELTGYSRARLAVKDWNDTKNTLKQNYLAAFRNWQHLKNKLSGNK